MAGIRISRLTSLRHAGRAAGSFVSKGGVGGPHPVDRLTRLTSSRHAGRLAGSFVGKTLDAWVLQSGTFTLTGRSLIYDYSGSNRPVGRLTRQTSSGIGGTRAGSFARANEQWTLLSGTFALSGQSIDWTTGNNTQWILLPGAFSMVGRSLDIDVVSNGVSWILQTGSFALYGRPINIESQAVSPETPPVLPGSKTYLQLCRDTRSSVGEAGDGPATVLNQVGMLGKIVGWVAEGYLDLQSEANRRWCWLQQETTLQLEAGRDIYQPGLTPWSSTLHSRIYAFDTNNAVLLAPDGSYNRINVLTWERFNARFPVTSDVPGRPTAVAFSPWGQANFDRMPDQAYTLRIGVSLRAQLLVNDSDVPDMPFEFHSYLVKLATIKYAVQRGDTTLYNMTEAERKRQHRSLVMRCAQPITYGPNPIA